MRNKLSILCGALAMAASGSAFAQTVTSQTIGGAPASANITITGNVQSSLLLSVTSTALTAIGPAVGTVAIGNFNSLNPTSVTATGVAANRNAANDGLFVVVDLDASLLFSGVTDTSIAVDRFVASGGPGDVALGSLRLGAAGTTWDDLTDGSTVADPGTLIFLCGDGAAAGTSCASGGANNHELAVFVSDATTGAFSTVVRYTGSAP